VETRSLRENCIGGICRIIALRAVGVERQNVDFVEIGFTDQMDLFFFFLGTPQQEVMYGAAHDFVFKIMKSRSFLYENARSMSLLPYISFRGYFMGSEYVAPLGTTLLEPP
jgi:hypothetical protein